MWIASECMRWIPTPKDNVVLWSLFPNIYWFIISHWIFEIQTIVVILLKTLNIILEPYIKDSATRFFMLLFLDQKELRKSLTVSYISIKIHSIRGILNKKTICPNMCLLFFPIISFFFEKIVFKDRRYHTFLL